MKINILQKKQKGRTDSFFYEGDIATIKKRNGTRLTLMATGDIGIFIKDKEYKKYHSKGEKFFDNGNIQDAIEHHKLTDRKLKILEKQGKLKWENNNWFEVVYQKKGNDFVDCDIGIVVWDYDDAMQLLKDYYKDKEY